MSYYQRRLPHWHPDHTPLFVTWRLAGSVPRPDPEFQRMSFQDRDAQLDRHPTGPLWLSDTRIATLLQDALIHGGITRHLYDLYPWCIMPNHVHLVIHPHVPLPEIMVWLKGRTARKANRILSRAGDPFWQDESFDHWIRNQDELTDLILYVENNPVAAGLADSAAAWPWSSASSEAGHRFLWPAQRP